jgi:hypothetical protein
MPLLTPPDLEHYAPSIPIADRTTVAIALAEALAFGPYGSNGRIDRRTEKEVKKLSASFEVILNHPPVDGEPITIEWREPKVNNQWIAVDEDAVTVDGNRLTVNHNIPLAASYIGAYGRSASYLNRTARPLRGNQRPELRVSYATGIDFTVDTDETIQIKAALGGIITLQYAAARGLTQMIASTNSIISGTSAGRVLISKAVEGEASVTYDSPSKANEGSRSLLSVGSSSGDAAGMMSDYLEVFKRYRFTTPTH